MADHTTPVFEVHSSDNADYPFIIYEHPQTLLDTIETSLEYLDDQPDETLTIVIKRRHLTDEQITNLEDI